jgi:hypothetical protein
MDDYEVEFVAASAGPCPVCGAAGGNCRGDSEFHGTINIFPSQRNDPRATFRVPHRIYEEVQVGSRTVKKLLYAKGDRITPAEAKRLGLLPSDYKIQRGPQ